MTGCVPAPRGGVRPQAARIAATLACALAVSGGPQRSAAAAVEPQALSTSAYLVDLARDHGLQTAGRQTPADVRYVQTLLRAAASLSPHESQAQVWLYEMALLEGEPHQARQALEALLVADPGNESAFVQWLQYGPSQLQTIEQRQDWFEELLQGAHPQRLNSYVWTEMARLSLQRFDRAAAQQRLARARELCPYNGDIPLLALDALGSDAAPSERLALLLEALRAHPLVADLAWQIGELLDSMEEPERALPFYDYAKSLNSILAADAPLDADRLMLLSNNALARIQPDAATDYARAAAHSTPGRVQYVIDYFWLCMYTGRVVDAEETRRALSRDFAAIKEPDQAPLELLAPAVWFYCTVEIQPQRALTLAESAARRAPGNPYVMRVLGWAQAISSQTVEARETLSPIARDDPFAAFQLARVLKEEGQDDAAAEVVRKLRRHPQTGLASEMLRQLGYPPPMRMPGPEQFRIAALLATFDDDVLSFVRDPGRFLEVDLTLSNLSPSPGQPWWAVVTLRNSGRFPITLGPDDMVNPVLLLSFTLDGDRQRTFPNLLTISLDQTRVLPPGAMVQVQRTIDVGPLRRASRMTPQQLQRVTVRAVLDPQQASSGIWSPGPTGRALRPLSFNRIPANTSPSALNAMFYALRQDRGSERFLAAVALCDLYGEAQRAARTRLGYAPEPVPADRVRTALLAALTDGVWETRIRVLDGLSVCGLDADFLRAAEGCLEHEHWAVRLMAIRVVARQGPGVSSLLRGVTERDPEELVREMARSYLERWRDAPREAGSGEARSDD
jgi:tetratricopeptide (TPR) repeat protein